VGDGVVEKKEAARTIMQPESALHLPGSGGAAQCRQSTVTFATSNADAGAASHIDLHSDLQGDRCDPLLLRSSASVVPPAAVLGNHVVLYGTNFGLQMWD